MSDITTLSVATMDKDEEDVNAFRDLETDLLDACFPTSEDSSFYGTYPPHPDQH
jgi:hypothetical protein